MEKINKLKFRFNKLFYFLFKERFNKTIDFSFPKNINRWDLIKDIINLKGYKSYLELGCDDDHSFEKIKIDSFTKDVSLMALRRRVLCF